MNKGNKEDQWIKQSLDRLDKQNIYQAVGLQEQQDRPSLQIIDETYSDNTEVSIEDDGYSKDHIQQPSATDQDVNDFLAANVDDPASEVDYQRVNAASAEDMAKREVDRQIMVQMLDEFQVQKDEAGVQKEPQTQIITQLEDGESNEQLQGFLRINPNPSQQQISDWVIQKGYDINAIQNQISRISNPSSTVNPPSAVMAQNAQLKENNEKLIKQNRKFKMLTGFILKNFNSLNQNRIKKTVQMLQNSNIKQLKERFGKCQTALLVQNKKRSGTKKKIFESNVNKFNKIGINQFNKKASDTDQNVVQFDRMRELAGL